MSDFRLFAATELEAFTDRIFVRMGAQADIAAEVARHLVRANLSGHDSHGVMRIAQYAGQVDRGELVPANRPLVIRESPTALTVDAQRGFGHFATTFALDEACAKAQRHGVAAAAIRHSTHIGRLGDYTERCAQRGLILILTVGMAGPGVGGMVIHGGRERFFGANVWSIGVPAIGEPMVFDGSTANIAVGKVHLAQAEGKSLPPGCIIDSNGTPSTNPADYYAGGAVVPLGGALAGHKGYGLALASALLGALAMIGDVNPTMAGAPVSGDHDAKGRVAGVFLLAIDPAAFGGAEAYRSMVEDCLAAARAVPPAAGHDEVLIPGEPSRRSRRSREANGIPLAAATCAELDTIAHRFGVAPARPFPAVPESSDDRGH